MRPKLADVAAKADVSVTTVSRVINNYGAISDKTREKVFAAMRELNYQPNSLARSLKGKASKLVGVIIPTIENPFFAELVAAIETSLFNNGYKMILCDAHNDVQKERTYLQMLQANQVDGIIAGAHNLGIEEYQQANLPIVSFDRQLSDQIPIVSSDNFQGGSLATRALYAAGARNIYFLGNPRGGSHPTGKRLAGYRATMNELNLSANVAAIHFEETLNLKKLTIEHLLVEQHPDGILCSDDMTALLVLQVAKQLHIRVPDKLKVIGYDGTKLIRAYHPELATVVQPISDLASLLVSILSSRIERPESSELQPHSTLPVQLLRASSLAHV